MTDIIVSKRNSPDKVTLTYDCPETITGWIERFGESEVTDVLNSAFYQRLQNIARIKFEEGVEAMQYAIDSWAPGHRAEREKKSPLDTAMSKIGQLSPDDLAALLKRVKEQQKALA